MNRFFDNDDKDPSTEDVLVVAVAAMVFVLNRASASYVNIGQPASPVITVEEALAAGQEFTEGVKKYFDE